jgi:hypothetical protein
VRPAATLDAGATKPSTCATFEVNLIASRWPLNGLGGYGEKNIALMIDGDWIDRFASQLGRRWRSIDPSLASTHAMHRAQQSTWRNLDPETAADAYVRMVEERRPVEPSAFLLVFDDAQADEDQNARAVGAAMEVFRQAGITPAAGARGWYERDCWDDLGFPEDQRPTDADLRAAQTWDQAVMAAEAATPGARQARQADRGVLKLRWR